MKRNFNKEFKEEFKKSFDNGLNKDTLKENLNLVPQEEDTIIFKKKPFYGLSSLFAALLIIVTASITLLVAHYADYDINNVKYIKNNEVLEAFEEFKKNYYGYNVVLVNDYFVDDTLSVLFIRLSNEISNKFAIYFHFSNEDDINKYELMISINDVKNTDYISYNCYKVYDINICNSNVVEMSIFLNQDKIFDFYIKF